MANNKDFKVKNGLDVGSTVTLNAYGTGTNTALPTQALNVDENGNVIEVDAGVLPFVVHNDTGATLVKGTVVYVSGLNGNTPEVSLARANSSSTMPAYGLVEEDIADTEDGTVVTFGSLRGLDVSDFGETGITFSLGDTVYISSSEAGKLTNVAPTGEANFIQNIGKIERASPTTNMTIKVGGAGRTNATPNLNQGKIFIGNSSNQAVAGSFGDGINVTNEVVSIGQAVGTTDSVTFGQVNLNDNGKAIFGTSGDGLEIFHDGSHSYITDSGTGQLRLRATAAMVFQNAAGTKGYATFVENGAVQLYHNGAVKFETASTGVDVTGTVTADGLTVDGSGGGNRSIELGAGRTADGNTLLDFVTDTTYTDYGMRLVRFGGANSASQLIHRGTGVFTFRAVDGGGVQFKTGSAGPGGADTLNMFVTASGDIRFYEDDGTTQGLTWDASTGRLGIGTTNPASTLDVDGEIRSVGVNLAQGNAGVVDARFAFNQDGTQVGWIGAPQWDSDGLYIYGPTASSSTEPVLKYSASQLELRTSNTNRLVIDSSGNVGIGTAPTGGYRFEVKNDGDTNAPLQIWYAAMTNGTRNAAFKGPEGGASASHSANPFVWDTGNAWEWRTDNREAFGIDKDRDVLFYKDAGGSATEGARWDHSSGNFGIGTSLPHELLEIVDRAPILQIRDTNTGISDNKATLRLAESGAGGSTDQYYDVALQDGNFGINYNLTNRFKIDRTTGGVSIGTTTILGSGSNSKLSVKSGADYAPAIAIGNDGSAASWARLDFVNDQVTGGGTGIFYYDQGANFVMRNDEVGAGVSITVTDTGPTLRAGALRVESSGVVRIPNLTGTGTQDVQADASGNLVRITSDQRLKKEIADSPYGLAAVQALRPVTYRWRNEANMGSATEVGFVAQEVQAVIPEMVNETHATGMLSVSYSKLTAVLTAAIKEQQTQIEALEARLAVLEATP